MAAPIENPFNREDMGVLLEQGLTLRQIGAVAARRLRRDKPVHHMTVGKWVILLGLVHNCPTRKREPILGNITLKRMYAVEKMSLRKIAARAAEIMNWPKPPTPQTVTRWLLDAGIRLRSASESHKIAVEDPAFGKKISEKYAARVAAGWKATGRADLSRFITADVIQRRTATRNANQVWRVYECTCRICLRTFLRRASRVRESGRRGYKFLVCSNRGCAGKAAAYLRNLPPEVRDVVPSDYNEDGSPKGAPLLLIKKCEYLARQETIHESSARVDD